MVPSAGFWSTIGDLIFPRWCAGCGCWDEDLCPACRQEFSTTWRRVDERAPYLQSIRPADAGREGLLRPGDPSSPFPVYALADYGDVVRKIIVSWKNGTNRGLTRELTGLVARHARDISILGDRGGHDHAVSIIPAPSRFRRRHEGRFVAGHLARALAVGIGEGAESSPRAIYRDVLLAPATGPGGLLDRLALASSRAGGGIALGRRGEKGRGIRIRGDVPAGSAILVDDVLTSGATLAGCSRALAQRGVSVIGAFVLAAARDPRRVSVDGSSFASMRVPGPAGDASRETPSFQADSELKRT